MSAFILSLPLLPLLKQLNPLCAALILWTSPGMQLTCKGPYYETRLTVLSQKLSIANDSSAGTGTSCPPPPTILGFWSGLSLHTPMHVSQPLWVNMYNCTLVSLYPLTHFLLLLQSFWAHLCTSPFALEEGLWYKIHPWGWTFHATSLYATGHLWVPTLITICWKKKLLW